MPHQTPISSRKSGMQNPLHLPAGYHSVPGGQPYVGIYDGHPYATNYYHQYQGGSDKSGVQWPSLSSKSSTADGTTKVRRVGSHESDEEAAATALLIAAGGSRLAGANVRKVKKENDTTLSSNISVNSTDGQEIGSLVSSSTNVDETSEAKPVNKSGTKPSTFPTDLHKVLSDSKFSGSVLEWLPSGTSWRVLRWDDLANKVLPAHFPDLCSKSKVKEGTKEEQSTSDRINNFLKHIRGWGFQEVKEVGPDMGSFQHEFFIRVAPNLCRHMRQDIDAVHTEEASSNETKNIVSPPRLGTRNFPPRHDFSPSSVHWTLTNMRAPSESRGFVSPEKKKKPAVDIDEGVRARSPSFFSNTHHPPTGYHLSYVSPSSQSQYTVSQGDRSNIDTIRAPDSPYYQRYAPSCLRSNRGGARVCRLDRQEESEKASRSLNLNPQRSYPVSNRGKGRRNPSRTMPLPQKEQIKILDNGSDTKTSHVSIGGKQIDGEGDEVENVGNKKRRLQTASGDAMVSH